MLRILEQQIQTIKLSDCFVIIIIIKISNSARCVVTVMVGVRAISVIHSSQIN